MTSWLTSQRTLEALETKLVALSFIGCQIVPIASNQQCSQELFYRETLELAVSLRLGRPLGEWLSRAITKRKHKAFSAE